MTQTKTVDLIIFMGQSNMAGGGTASKAPLVPKDIASEFRVISDPTKLYPLTEPFGQHENNPFGISESLKTGSLVSSFVLHFNKRTRVPVGAISASKRASKIEDWQPGRPLLTDTIERFHAAKEWLEQNVYNLGRKFMVWCQGESDFKKTTDENYLRGTEMIVEEMLHQGIEKCLLIRIGQRLGNVRQERIIHLQDQLCRNNDDIVLVSTQFADLTYMMKDDGLHFTQAAYNQVRKEAGSNASECAL